MQAYICTTCATQFTPSDQQPAHCPICEDERQYIGHQGQQWTTLDTLRAERRTSIQAQEPGLTGIGIEPSFAIGQRALLVEAPGGNILWDCIPLIDDAAIEAVRSRGGLAAIAISHPHYYSGMVEWSRAFGGVPIYLHADDRQWVMRPDPAIVFWEGETHALGDGLTLIRGGGHYPGGTLLHWAAGANGRGALLTGDIIQVVSDRRYVSFMYSYPNMIPLHAAAVQQIVQAVTPYAFDRIYGAWFPLIIAQDAKAAVERSAARYLRALEGVYPA
jgi:glyoxylase-like metal-dependent hydrolase (beta-lactamase superfamily II)